MSQDSIRKVKKGEQLFKENDASSTVYVVQSGKLNLIVERSGKKIEVGTVGPMQILGEQSVISNGRHLMGAEATQETKVAEIPADALKPLYEKLPAAFKLFVRGLLEEAKQARIALRTMKMETDKSPCPQMAIPRVFTLAHILPRHIGKKDAAKPDEVRVAWLALKQYANRFFGEPPVRLRSVMDLLKKLGKAQFEVKTNEEGEEELTDLTITGLQSLEDFAEFYQYHLFKGQHSEAIYVDPLALRIAKALVEFSEGAPENHKGAVQVDYAQVVAQFKTKYRVDLKNTHLDAMERKGLFCTRRSINEGPLFIEFDRKEYVKMVTYWSIILEIDKWNEKGFVDLNEKEEVVAADGNACPSCQGPIAEANKFCPNCGAKLEKAA